MDYLPLLQEVQTLLGEFGRSVTVQRLGGAPISEDTPWRGAEAAAGNVPVEATVDTVAVFVPAGGLDMGWKQITDELLKRCEQVCLMAPLDAFDLRTATVILDDGERWAINWAQRLKPGDTALLFAFGVSR